MPSRGHRHRLPKLIRHRRAGCTSGTGLVAAKCFAKKGAAHVFLLNRPSPRAEAALTDVKAVAAEGCVVTHVDYVKLSVVIGFASMESDRREGLSAASHAGFVRTGCHGLRLRPRGGQDGPRGDA